MKDYYVARVIVYDKKNTDRIVKAAYEVCGSEGEAITFIQSTTNHMAREYNLKPQSGYHISSAVTKMKLSNTNLKVIKELVEECSVEPTKQSKLDKSICYAVFVIAIISIWRLYNG